MPDPLPAGPQGCGAVYPPIHKKRVTLLSHVTQKCDSHLIL